MLRINTLFKKTIAAVVMCAMAFTYSSLFLNECVSFASVGEYGIQNESNKNVVFDSYFVLGEENKGYVAEAGIGDENLAIRLNVGVKDVGYLRNASIEFTSETNLNFEIGNLEENDLVESVKGYTIKLNQISYNDNLELVLPIKYLENKKANNLSSDIKVSLRGVYIDADGDALNVNSEIKMNLSWISNSKITARSELTKFVKYETDTNKGLIVQTQVTIGLDKKNLPVERTEINLDALKINDLEASKVNVISNERDDFSEENWNYDTKSGKINIVVSNKEVMEDTETFIITYIYEGNMKVKYPLILECNINSNIYMEGTSEKISGDFAMSYEIEEEVGDIVTYTQEAIEDNISKGNIIANKYSKENNYETIYGYKYVVNVAETTLLDKIILKDINEVAITKNEKEYSLKETSKYRSISITKSSFDKILGEDGYVYVLDSGKKIATINSETLSEEDYIVDISKYDVSKINLETSKPISAGNLDIIVLKEINDTDYSISEIRKFDSIENSTSASIVFEGNVESNIGKKESNIKLENTNSNAVLSINRESLSTIVKNDGVELKVELNNNEVGTDFYKNPVFEIVLPEEIKEIKIDKVSVINADEAFEIDKVTAKRDSNRNIIIRVELKGTQTAYSLNKITNGTNILIDADMTLDVYATNTEKEIVLNYINEDATSYENGTELYGTSKTKVEFATPTGLVSVNTISGYDDKDSQVTSVDQGIVTDKVEIFSDEKVSTMDILVMNNNENDVKDVKILGRFPFKGNTDVKTGEELGTTIDTKLSSKIKSNSKNKTDVEVYYSDNSLATDDLNKDSNNWSKKATANSKSYLIVADKDYVMEKGDVLNFSYDYVIPANLEHNEEMYGSFATYYTNVTDVAESNEVSSPDKVGLVTGQGPKLSLTTTVDSKNNEASEYEYVKYSVTVKNTGEEDAENVVVNIPVPTRATFADYTAVTTTENQGGWSLDSDASKTYNVGTLKPNESKTYDFYAQINKLPTIEEYYASYEGFTKNSDGTYSIYEKVTDKDGEVTYKETKIDSLPDVYSEFTATVTAKELAKTLESNKSELKIKKANIVTTETIKTETEVVNINEEMTYEITVKNTSGKDMKSVKVEKVLPKEISYKEAYVVGYEADGITTKKITSVSYDESTRKLTWTIDELKKGRTIHVKAVVMTNDLEEGIYQTNIESNSLVKANEEDYKTGTIVTVVAKPKLVISQESDVTNKYVTEGQEINYKFTVKNEGLVKAQSVSFVDTLPEKVKIRSLAYISDGIKMEKVVANNEDATVYSSIQPKSELVVNVKAVTLAIDKPQETIDNYATISGDNITASKKTNIVTHIIERTNKTVEDEEEDDNYTSNGTPSQEDSVTEGTTQSYKITGSAWLDTDRNGKYTKDDRMIAGVEVILINATTGKKVASTSTIATGTYTFENLSKGKYYVGFYYNTKKYGLTEYKKNNVGDNVNSDAYASEYEGKTIGLTDTITVNQTSISNVDLGLVDATVFDLSLSKKISKITVQNSKETKKYNFNTSIAKVDIPAKYLSNSKVYIEYKITVKNEGEVAGYAKQIVDYKDSGLQFSPELNKGWYEGSDGNIYTKALANQVINAGQTAELTLILTKQMTETNTGVVNNSAEIAKAYNAAGIADKDSTPGNKVQSEDDYASSDTIISVKTGETLIYMSAIIVIAIIGIISGYALYKNRYKIKRVLRTRKVVD